MRVDKLRPVVGGARASLLSGCNWHKRPRVRLGRWRRRYNATPMRITPSFFCTTRAIAIAAVVRCHGCLRLKRHDIAVLSRLFQSWRRLRSIPFTWMTASFTILTRRLRLVAFLLALSTGMTTSLGSIAEVSFPSLRIRSICVVLSVGEGLTVSSIIRFVWWRVIVVVRS